MVIASEESQVLFAPVKLGKYTLSHKIGLAPMTRMRATKYKSFYVPNDLMVQYYSQRATKGGFLLTEACPISATASGYPGVPGIFTEEQVQGWKKITDAVHEKGGIIFCQLWHVGRATVALHIDGKQPLSSVSTPLSGPSLYPDVKYEDAPPRAMIKEDFNQVIQDFQSASRLAIEEAGFDGVEIHAANGYLFEQFLHDNINTRNDEYGGRSKANRSKFLFEVIEGVTSEIGFEKTGIRLSPYNYFQGTRDSDPNAMWSFLCEKIVELEKPLAYVHMVEPRFDEVLSEEDKLKSLLKETVCNEFSLTPFREILKKKGIMFITAGGYDKESAISKIESESSDLIMFGRYFISNPDLVWRIKRNIPLQAYDRNTFYGANPPQKGYTTYKAVDTTEV